jgi:hypothetical protein
VPSPFATATEFEEITGVEVGTDLSRIQSILDLSSAMIRRYLDQDVSQVIGEQEVFQETDREWLLLTQRPVTAITELTVEGSAFTDYRFERWGQVFTTTGADWTYGATVTYTHGYTETEPEFLAVKAVCIDVASRAYLMNRQGESESFGPAAMQSVGWAPSLFLTQDNMHRLMDLGKVGVG